MPKLRTRIQAIRKQPTFKSFVQRDLDNHKTIGIEDIHYNNTSDYDPTTIKGSRDNVDLLCPWLEDEDSCIRVLAAYPFETIQAFAEISLYDWNYAQSSLESDSPDLPILSPLVCMAGADQEDFLVEAIRGCIANLYLEATSPSETELDPAPEFTENESEPAVLELSDDDFNF